MDWYLQVLKKYAVFEGRAQRKEYWMFVLYNFMTAFMLWFLFGTLDKIFGSGTTLSTIALTIYYLGMLIPCIAVGIRRMHDIGRTGWWVICPVVNIVFACLDSQPGANIYGPNPKGV